MKIAIPMPTHTPASSVLMEGGGDGAVPGGRVVVSGVGVSSDVGVVLPGSGVVVTGSVCVCV